MKTFLAIAFSILFSLMPLTSIKAVDNETNDVVQIQEAVVGNKTIHVFYVRYTPKENITIKVNGTVLSKDMTTESAIGNYFCSLDPFIEVFVDGVVLPHVKLSSRGGVHPTIVTDLLYCTRPTDEGYQNTIFSAFAYEGSYTIYDGHPSGKPSYTFESTVPGKEFIERNLNFYHRLQVAIIVDGDVVNTIYPFYWVTSPPLYPFSDEKPIPPTDTFISIVSN